MKVPLMTNVSSIESRTKSTMASIFPVSHRRRCGSRTSRLRTVPWVHSAARLALT